MIGRNIARYMCVDKLIRPFKDMLDASEMTLTAVVELSNLSENEQGIVATHGCRLDEKAAKTIRAEVGSLMVGKLEEIQHSAKTVRVKILAEVEKKYFSGMKVKEWTELVMQALDAWFARKEDSYV